MRLKFTKMQGAGNDFVVLDGVRQKLALTAAQYRALADRQFGIGADQVLLVEPPDAPDVDFVYRIFNADGDEVEQCGNGARCFVRFVREQGLTDKAAVRARTVNRVIVPRMEDDGRVTVDMGVPVLETAQVPFDTRGLVSRTQGRDTLWPLALPGAERWISVVSTLAFCRCCRVHRPGCACTSAARARRWPAAAVRVRLPWPACCAACSMIVWIFRPAAGC
jgi:diaminopimelate epimerase